jgi:hypothetical protein
VRQALVVVFSSFTGNCVIGIENRVRRFHGQPDARREGSLTGSRASPIRFAGSAAFQPTPSAAGRYQSQ